MTPIFVTGLGAVSAAGASVEAIWQAALAGKIRAEWIATLQSGQRIPGYRCAKIEPGEIPAKLFHRLDRFAQLGLLAADEAWRSARLDERPVDPRRVALIIGTSRGPVTAQAEVPALIESRRIRPSTSVYTTVASLTGVIGTHLGARGTSLTISTTCTSASASILLGSQQIRAGLADVVVVGGAEAPLHPAVLEQFQAAGVLAVADDPARACRPCDAARCGTVLGEGAGFLVLESAESAARRGVAPRSLLRGGGMAAEPGRRSGLTDDAQGMVDGTHAALALAGMAPGELDGVHLHGTGTLLNDLTESRGVAAIFGADAAGIPCFSTKPVTGHCLGASGGLQSVLTVRALEDQILPPTVNCENLDPAFALDVVRGEPRRLRARSLLALCSGFWGNHVSLIFAAA